MNRWDERYNHERFFYGRTPNYFVAEQLQTLEPGRGLYLAEGEGRNAVFAAGLGHQVTAVDTSAVGKRKALELAEHRGVQLTYHVANITTHRWFEQQWDHIVLCFSHLPPAEMAAVHAKAAAALVPGGVLILCAFSKAQLGRDSGGPPEVELLHDLEVLKGQFQGLELAHAAEREVDLRESVGHVGPAMVIEILGEKP